MAFRLYTSALPLKLELGQRLKEGHPTGRVLQETCCLCTTLAGNSSLQMCNSETK